ncbi:unnamed protein product [Musa textilis]
MPSPTQKNTTAALSPAPPPPPPPPPPPSSNKWGPYSSAKDFDANMATVLVVLVCATALAFALHAVFRLLLRRLRRRLPRPPAGGDKPRAGTAPPQLPGSVVFSAGATAVAGAPECAICLAELAEGERVRVLPACSHGFHAQCVEAWLVGRSSCPTCRAECRPSPAQPAEP